MRIRTLTVSEVNNYLKRILINDPILSNIVVKGEISNFKLHSSGHAYFSIKDENSKLKCIMFNKEFSKVDFLPRDGMKVILRGYLSLYEKNGDYQLYVNEMKEEGLGDLHVAFEKLKNKLEKKGYFDDTIKKPIPFFPRSIGVVTSPTGAAIRDIISVITRRNSYVNIVIYPSLVQGENAAINIVEGIQKLNELEYIDTIIIGRGGGSLEELWPFNEEIVANAIYDSKKPIISAVGHETDFAISDFVADLRAPTPSAAGELAAPALDEISNYVEHLFSNIKRNINNKLSSLEDRLENYNEDRLARYLIYSLRENHQTLDYLYSHLNNNMKNKIDISKELLRSVGDNLNTLSPLATLSRGYTIAHRKEGNKLLTSIHDINIRDKVNLLLKDGLLECTVENIKRGDKCIEGKINR